MPRGDREPPGLIAFEGVLPDTASPFTVRIEIVDWDFVKYPRIELLSDPEGFRPHVDELGCLCYLGPGAVVFDRHQPLENFKHCLAAAARELNRQASLDYRHEESRYEFVRYWSGGAYTLLGTIHPLKRLHPTKVGFIGNEQFIVADDPSEIAKIRTSILHGRGKKDVDERIYPAWVITLDVDPWLGRNGPPDTWGKLWAWIETVDPRGADCLRALADRRDFAETDRGIIVFRHDTKFFGAFTGIPQDIRETRALMKFKRGAPSALAGYLKNHAGARIEILTFEVMEVGSDFLHRRNLGMAESLGGKKIHLVGAGAIGGFLAQQLSRLGAGANGGELRVIDPDILGSENIGRHLLGIDSLLRRKATAVADFLTRQFPMSRIVAEVADARHVTDLFDCDLIIEATGEEALSLVLNEMHQERLASGGLTPPMLFAWVLGNGEVVQCLLSDGGNRACYDCLNLPDRDGLERQRFPVLKATPDTKFIGCHTMRPYAVTAPAAAAALAAQMVADWKDGRPKPRFRTLYLGRGDHLHNIKSEADPERLAGCATCSKT
jgi:hypothetical protein